MQIVTDSGSDISLSSEQQKDLNVHVVPLNVSLDNVTYREGVDIQPAEFYPLLADTEDMPTTSQPSAGEFADTYRKILEYDQDILSIHISSGLSGTYNSALAAAQMLPEANITVIDAKTLSAAAGWQVEAAARAQVRTFKRAVQRLVNIISDKHPPGSALRVQVLHSYNFEGAEMLKDLIDQTFECTWLPEGHISLVLGAHTGPSMIGAAYALQEEFEDF
jgi:fatty acid-binding protein DegV